LGGLTLAAASVLGAMAGVAFGLAAALPSTASAATATDATTRQERFRYLLRTYPERPPRDTLAQAARLVDDGDFADRDRAEYWIGSALLSLHDPAAARLWFARLQHDHPESRWVEHSWLALGDAAAQERRYRLALDWYRKAQSARDEAVREMARIAIHATEVLRTRQLLAWTAGAFAAAVAALLIASLLRHRPVALWPLPSEARIVLPVLGVLALLSVRQDPSPRAAILELCAGSALLVLLAGLRLRAAAPGRGARTVHAAGTLAALFALAYVAVYRGGLIGMLLETLRVGAE
jgi:tetratricopeptide (TPR) repeat protein